jgi:hypothetical protein
MKLFLLFFLFITNELSSQNLETDTAINCFDFVFDSKKQNYMLGESIHYHLPTHKLKTEFVLSVLKSKAINQIIWEGDMLECYFGGKTIKGDTSNKAIKAIFSGAWHSPTMFNFFKKLSQEDFTFIGMDFRPCSNFFRTWISDKLNSLSYPKTEIFIISDSIVSYKGLKIKDITIEEGKSFNKVYDDFLIFLKNNQEKFDIKDYLVIERGIQNRKKLIDFCQTKGWNNKLRKRDKMMGENIIWIDSIFNFKSLTWAHNGHNAYSQFETDKKRDDYKLMGNYLPKTFKARTINIAVSTSIKSNTFEYDNKGTKKYSVVDLKNQTEIVKSKCNGQTDKSILGEQFDKLIIIND